MSNIIANFFFFTVEEFSTKGKIKKCVLLCVNSPKLNEKYVLVSLPTNIWP